VERLLFSGEVPKNNIWRVKKTVLFCVRIATAVSFGGAREKGVVGVAFLAGRSLAEMIVGRGSDSDSPPSVSLCPLPAAYLPRRFGLQFSAVL
jgi:hypothetical protein